MSARRSKSSGKRQAVLPPQKGPGQWVFVDSSADSFKNVYNALEPWQRELIARRWLKSEGLYWSAEHRLVNSFFMHLAACCRQPAGRADGVRGSQQCSFELEVMHVDALRILHINRPGVFESHPQARYSIGEDNRIAWVRSKAIDSFYMDDVEKMSEWIGFHRRAPTEHLSVFGSSKGVVVRSEGVKVVATLIPPFIIELCRRSHDRLVIAVTCNLFTFNDHGGLDLPPEFPYAEGERSKFRQLAINNLMGMRNSGVRLSKLMKRLLPPAYRALEEEGEEAAHSEEDPDEQSA